MWGFLSEFWDAITGITIDAWEYTSDWFKQIGLSVAGALGAVFDWLLHYVNDFFIFMGWIFSGLRTLFIIFITPMTFFASFLKNFWSAAIQSPISIDDSLNVSSSGALAIFNLIPYWSTVGTILGVCLIAVAAFGILFLLLRI